MNSSQPFLVTSPVIQIIFGAMLTLGALPALVFQLIGFLKGEDIAVVLGSEMVSIMTAAVLLFLSVVMLTWRHKVTVNERLGSITWTRHTLGVSWISATWSRHEITAIEVARKPRPPGYVVVARSETHQKLLYQREGSSGLTVARSIADDLHIPLKQL